MPILFFACGRDPEVVAKVGPTKVTITEVKRLAASEPYNFKALLRTPEGRRKYIENVINAKVLMLEAGKLGLDETEEFKQKMDMQREKLLLAALFRRLIDSGAIEPTDAEIKEYYSAHPDEFEKPVSIRLSQILIMDRAVADSVAESIRSGKVKFEQAAADNSEDGGSKGKGGDIGFVERNDLIENLADAAFAIVRIGDIAGPVSTPYGNHILKLTGRKKLEPVKFEAAYKNIKSILQKKKLEQYIEKSKKSHKIKLYLETLAGGLASKGGK